MRTSRKVSSGCSGANRRWDTPFTSPATKCSPGTPSSRRRRMPPAWNRGSCTSHRTGSRRDTRRSRARSSGDKAHSAVFDNSKIKRFVPDFTCTVPWAEGVRRSLAWFEADASRRTIDEGHNRVIDALVSRLRRLMPQDGHSTTYSGQPRHRVGVARYPERRCLSCTDDWTQCFFGCSSSGRLPSRSSGSRAAARSSTMISTAFRLSSFSQS